MAAGSDNETTPGSVLADLFDGALKVVQLDYGMRRTLRSCTIG
jgi:hypothetical protein